MCWLLRMFILYFFFSYYATSDMTVYSSEGKIYLIGKLMSKVLYNLLLRKQIWHSHLAFLAKFLQPTIYAHSMGFFYQHILNPSL